MPGDGTSASDNSSDGDEYSTKKAIARSKNKKRNARLAASNMAAANGTTDTIDKENSDEKKVRRQCQCHHLLIDLPNSD